MNLLKIKTWSLMQLKILKIHYQIIKQAIQLPILLHPILQLPISTLISQMKHKPSSQITVALQLMEMEFQVVKWVDLWAWLNKIKMKILTWFLLILITPYLDTDKMELKQTLRLWHNINHFWNQMARVRIQLPSFKWMGIYEYIDAWKIYKKEISHI